MQGEHPGQNPFNGLIIPYTTDPAAFDFKRPVKPPQVSWWCPSIVTDRPPGTFVAGAPISVTVTVGNSGQGNLVPALNVYVMWTPATTTFTLPRKLLGQTPMLLGNSGEVGVADTITCEIAADAPPHICLLAYVTGLLMTDQDKPNPINDTRWGQRNLTRPVVDPSGKFSMSFNAGNPFGDAAAFDLVVRPLGQEAALILSDVLGSQVGQGMQPEMTMQAQGATPTQVEGTFTALNLRMEPEENRQITLRGSINRPAGASGVVILDIEQRLKADGHDPSVVGSIGVVLG